MDAKEKIKQIMKNKNISEYRLAKLSGLSQSTISNIFVRNTAPTLPTIEAICNGLGITMSQFFAEDSESGVFLSDEQKEMFDVWSTLTAEQKEIIRSLINVFNK